MKEVDFFAFQYIEQNIDLLTCIEDVSKRQPSLLIEHTCVKRLMIVLGHFLELHQLFFVRFL